MDKHSAIKSLSSLMVILTAFGTSSCNSSTHIVDRFELYETFKEAYDLYCEYGGFDYSSWVGFDYDYYFDGYQRFLTTYLSNDEYYEILGQETDYQTITATDIDGVINGHEELDKTHWGTYIGGSASGSYYDGSTLYLKESKSMANDGSFAVSSLVTDLNFLYYSETPFAYVDGIIQHFITLGQDGENLAELGYLLSGSIETSASGTTITLEEDVIKESWRAYSYNGERVYAPGTTSIDIIISVEYDIKNHPISFSYENETSCSFALEYYEGIVDGYEESDTSHLVFKSFDGEITPPNWIY